MVNVSLPVVPPRRERLAGAEEAAALIAAVPPADRAIWAIAFYAGLRFAEIQALDWGSLDFDRNLIRVERAWDRAAGFIEPKSRSGRRRVPMTATLRAHLLAHRLRKGSPADGFVFPNRRGDRPLVAAGEGFVEQPGHRAARPVLVEDLLGHWLSVLNRGVS